MSFALLFQNQEIGNFNLDLSDWIDDDDVLAMIDSNDGVPINTVNETSQFKPPLTTPLHQESTDKYVQRITISF